jgi:hypothetical protein
LISNDENDKSGRDDNNDEDDDRDDGDVNEGEIVYINNVLDDNDDADTNAADIDNDNNNNDHDRPLQKMMTIMIALPIMMTVDYNENSTRY